MNIPLEFAAEVAFGRPLVYKGLKIYPAECKDYYLFLTVKESLLLNRMQEKNIRLINLPYLEYVYERAKKSKEGINDWVSLMAMLRISFKTDKISVGREKHQFYLMVTQDEKEIRISATDFETIKDLICELDDILVEVLDPEWEKQLQDAQAKLAAAKPTSAELDFEDVLCSLGVILGKLPYEMENMPIRTFNRYKKFAFGRDEYLLNHAAELQGTKFKSKIEHWSEHYEKQSKYDNVLTNKSPQF